MAENPAQLWAWTLGRQIGEDKWQFLPWTNSRYASLWLILKKIKYKVTNVQVRKYSADE